MKVWTGVLVILVLAGSVPAVSPAKVKDLRRVRKIAGADSEVIYKFQDEQDEYVTLSAQSASRGSEAAKAWAATKKADKVVAVIARSPFGGGETAESYWPTGARAELLKNVVEPLKKAGIDKVVLTDTLKREVQQVGRDEAKRSPGNSGNKTALPGLVSLDPAYDYQFVLLIGLHHEPIPHRGVRRTAGGKVVYSRSSRVNAWAILFHAPTATAFWGATATASARHRAAADPLNDAAASALSGLDFTGIGSDNIPQHIKQLANPKGFGVLDTAAMLAQTQRADAAAAIVKAAGSQPAFMNKVRVLRYFSQKGVVQDYRIDPAKAKQRRHVLISQSVMMRVLLLEHLRGLRGIQPCAVVAHVPRMTDAQIPGIGQRLAGRLRPLSGDDEIVLISELANADFRAGRRYRGIFRINRIVAIRNLGFCRVHIDKAMVVAQSLAQRKPARPRPGRKPRRDYIKEAGAAALKQLVQAKADQQ